MHSVSFRRFNYDGEIHAQEYQEYIHKTGASITDIFNLVSIKEAIDRALERCPAGWYWTIDGENKIHFKRTDKENPDHTLYLGKHINEIEIKETMENVRNGLYVVGGTPDGSNQLFRKYQNSQSQRNYGERTEIANDGGIIDTDTADRYASWGLGIGYLQESEMVFDIIDRNQDDKTGYDIESIKAGDTIKIRDSRTRSDDSLWDLAEWDRDYWDYNKRYPISDPIIVQRIDYYGDGAKIYASRQVQGVGYRLEDAKREIDNLLRKNIAVETDTSSELEFYYDENGDLQYYIE